MDLLTFKNIGLSFRRKNKPLFWAIKDVSFSLREGETLGVVGSNGAGKSTLLRIIAGTYRTDCGEVIRNTESCALLSLQLGFIPYLNGIDNLILSGMLQGLKKSYIVSKIPNIIEFTELGDMIYEPINTWSTGMVARLGFAIAIEIKPKILLIDETLSVGDAAFRQKSAQTIEARIKSNQTVVLVSHSAHTIIDMCDRVLWLEKGKTMAIGETNDIMSQYNQHVKKLANKVK